MPRTVARLALIVPFLVVFAPLARSQEDEEVVEETGEVTLSTARQLGPEVEAARNAAFGRVAIAVTKMSGLKDERDEARARALAKTLIADDLNWDQAKEIVQGMVARLDPATQMVRGAADDKRCRTYAAYVRGNRPPVVLCPAFFSSSPEQRIRTLMHESAHMAGIGTSGDSVKDVYRPVWRCSGNTPEGFESADSWAVLAYCLADGPDDR